MRQILKALSAVRGGSRVTDQTPEGKFQALEKYAKDLTELRHGAASLTPSSAAMKRSAALSRC